jgi:hypothetical protein
MGRWMFFLWRMGYSFSALLMSQFGMKFWLQSYGICIKLSKIFSKFKPNNLPFLFYSSFLK